MATLAIAGAALAAVGQLAGTAVNIQATDAASRTATAEAKAREQEAISLRDAAAYEEGQARRRASLLLGKQQAISAASGVALTSGSPLLAELDTVRQSELEALNIRRTGDVAAQGKRFEGSMAQYRARILRRQIPWIAAAGVAGAGGSVLSMWKR